LASFLVAFSVPVQANLLLMPGDVIEGHAKEEEDCDNCHKKFDKAAQPKLCADCHKDIRKDLNEKRGYHGRLDQDKQCKECHTEHQGRDANIVILDKDKFDHKQTDYPLKGRHAESKVECEDCHKTDKKYSEASSICYDCHQKDDDKDGHKGNYGKKCETCHIVKDWDEIQFDHDKETDYKLLYKHKEAKCDTCHTGDLYEDELKDTCVSCHKKDDDKDGHKGKYGKKCESCHIEKGWKEILFNHNKETDYKLLHKHKKVKCGGCHKKGNLYKKNEKDKLKDTCISCHKKDDDKKKGHKGKYGEKCESCHTEKGWKKIVFNHDKDTDYKLLHKHKKVKCGGCHKKGDLYKENDKDKLKDTCVSCHKEDDDKDGHKGKFGDKCETCHTERGWAKIPFDHDKDTDYKLFGKHKDTKCVDCHTGDLYEEELKADCFSCHEKDDEHEGQEGKKCETCHDEMSWTEALNFDHNLMSKFTLLGGHSIVKCRECHEEPTFKDAKSDCWSCHEEDDVHKRKLGTECKECHNVRNWKSWDFDHNQADFTLDSTHKDVGCYECHQRPINGKVVASSTCGSCHDRDDVHNGSYGVQCQRCHDGDKWSQIKVSQ
jgi:hypothetical protein